MNKWLAQRKLSVLWFANSGIIILLFVFFTIVNRFGSHNDTAWEWLTANIVPTLTLMIGTFANSDSRTNADVFIEKFYYRLALTVSAFYFLLMYLTILMAPIAFSLINISMVDLLTNSKIYFNVSQGVVTLVLGLFFTKKGTESE
ncbi:hypothetical protein [Mucilaginibacter agri]|nr:hypothetical protein [Mucilaginibacter agri]